MNGSDRRTVLVLALAMFLEASGYGIVAPTLPVLARNLGLGFEQLGFLFSLYALVGVVLVLPLGYAADRWGRKALLLVGFAALTIASVGYVFAAGYVSLLISRTAQGVGGTAIWVASLSMGGDLSAREAAGRGMAWITGAWSLGFLLGPAMGGMGTLTLPFIAYAFICAVGLVMAVWCLRETQAVPINLSLTRLWRLLSTPEVQCSSLATFSLAFYYGSFDAFVPWLLGSHGGSRLEIALLFSALAVPSVLLPRLVGQSADRLGDRKILNFGLPTNGLLAIGFLDLIMRFPPWLGFVALGVTEVAIYVPAVAMLQRAVNKPERGTAMAIHILVFSAGMVVGPIISGQVIPQGGYGTMFLLMGAMSLLTAGAVETILRLRGSSSGRGGFTRKDAGTGHAGSGPGRDWTDPALRPQETLAGVSARPTR